MSLSPGTRLGSYEVIAAIGAGGMGEVYRARDSRLQREVAIKILPEAFASDPERLARFEREAHVLASLNHPHIAQIYGVEESGSTRALVMELVGGETLADRLARGPVPLDEALAVGHQIADALAAAHDQGVVHRDLKPANIKVTESGAVKVLDFGLAKAFEPATAGAGAATMSPTITSPAMTQAGIILGTGTAAYMSPEQARGKAVDRRADIWAFGVVLYEMVTGVRPFTGDNVTDSIASVIKEQPDVSRVPHRLRRLVARCLEKDPAKRLRDIGDAWDLLDDDRPAAVAGGSRVGRSMPWAVAAAGVVLAAGVATVHLREPAPTRPPVVRFQMAIAVGGGVSPPVISPDGTRVLYYEGNRLVVRALDSLQVRPLPGTESLLTQSFWSHDSRFIVVGVPGALRIFPADGGSSRHLCDVSGLLLGGFWTADGRIVFSVSGDLFSVPASGGTPVPLDGQRTPRRIASGAPLLPDEEHFLYTVGRGPETGLGIHIGSIRGEAPRRLLPDTEDTAYVPAASGPGGYVLFVRDGRLLAQRLDERRLELVGEPVPVADGIRGFTASPSGSLIYGADAPGRSLVWLDRRGEALGSVWAPGQYGELALAPDDSRLAVVRMGGTPTTWIHDFARESSAPLSGVGSVKPTWTPDGQHLLVASSRGSGRFGIFRSQARIDGRVEPLVQSDTFQWPWDVSPDGAWLLYGRLDSRTKEDLWLFPLTSARSGASDTDTGRGEPFLVTDYTETDAEFSPDGRSVAYVSDESGRFEVYVRAFPVAPGGKRQVSSGGGYQPRWRRDGRELFYFTADGRLMSVDVSLGATPAFGSPTLLFQAAIFGGGGTTSNHYWDVSADGQRFLINTLNPGSTDSHATVLLNWQSGLK